MLNGFMASRSCVLTQTSWGPGQGDLRAAVWAYNRFEQWRQMQC